MYIFLSPLSVCCFYSSHKCKAIEFNNNTWTPKPSQASFTFKISGFKLFNSLIERSYFCFICFGMSLPLALALSKWSNCLITLQRYLLIHLKASVKLGCLPLLWLKAWTPSFLFRDTISYPLIFSVYILWILSRFSHIFLQMRRFKLCLQRFPG